jgi:3,4-dihydroxy 2-butanone 4-phosphate synthase/GTP cyclohydrolase II
MSCRTGNNQMRTCAQSIETFATTKLCVIHDDIGADRSVLVAPAQEISSDHVNRILAITGGLTFVALSPERTAAFMLSPMYSPKSESTTGRSSSSLAQLTSVEAREGVTTGISAADRATTIRILGASQPHPRALVKPGHIFPVSTKQGGSLVKAEIPEAALDLTTLAGFSDAALFVDLLNRTGDLVSQEEATSWAHYNGIPLISISEIIQYRLVREPLIARLSEAELPTREAGTMRAIAYRSKIHDVEHVALVKGNISGEQPALVRVQVENTVADVLGGRSPATRQQILGSMRAIKERGSGILLYLRRNSLSELALFSRNDQSSPRTNITPSVEMREYGIGAQILRDLGVTQIELLSSSHKNLLGLDSFGISVVTQRSIPL